MALRTPALWMGDPAVQHTAQDDRLAAAGLYRGEPGQTAASRPLATSGGAIHGPAGTMGEVTLLSNTQFTVNPARWIVQSSASALGGTYEVTNDAVATLGITAQDASQYRKSYWGVWLQDKFVAGSGDNLPHWGLIDGALAASAIAAALPSAGSLPTHFLALGEFLIPPTGNAVTFTPYSPRTSGRHGILPVLADGLTYPGHDGAAPRFDGDYRHHPTYGLQTGLGGVWVPGKMTSAGWALFPIVGAPYFAHVNLTTGSGIAPGAGAIGLQYRREGDRVFLRGLASSSGGVGAGTGGTNPLSTALPAEFRPPITAFVFPQVDSFVTSTYYLQTTRLEIGSNGILYAARGLPAGATTIWDQVSYSLAA